MTICLWISILSVTMILFQQNKLIYKNWYDFHVLLWQ